MKRIGVIGAGRIGLPVIAFLRESPAYSLVSVLVRSERHDAEWPFVTDVTAFFANEFDLIIETAGPAALREHGVQALAQADVWSVSACALADAGFRRLLESIGVENGHRLRLVSGSISGLDGVAAIAAADPSARLRLFAKRPRGGDRSETLFSGALSAGARAYPNEVNFAVAAALAGSGMEEAILELSDSGPDGSHALGFHLESSIGAIDSTVTLEPLASDRLHPVAASLIAGLKRETQTIWAG